MKDRQFSYNYGDNNIYVNLTNKCSNSCDFCIRKTNCFTDLNYNLWLEYEPSVQEVIDSISEEDLIKAKEIVFCGYGEPTYRINELVELGKYFKSKEKITRLNTNGQGNLINKKDITPLLKGAIDIVNISLNEATPEKYQKICHSIYGEGVFEEIQDFAMKSKKYVDRVIFSVVDVIPKDSIKKCKEIAQKLGVEYRIREYTP
ncbi:MAG: TatD family nuclease-associated radical SAM protein [Christensenellales bacterium]|jgi:TatD family-associated radical SAM protein|nr:radical SAM protein [Clostridiales bacterium]